MSMCRQIDGTASNVSERVFGTQGHRQPGRAPIRRQERLATSEGDQTDPYVQEHDDLFASIRAGKPINEGRRIAESTLTAIMGRMATYTGQAVTWDQALNSKLDSDA